MHSATLLRPLARLLPAVALFSLFVVLDDGLKWLGVLGLVPLFLFRGPGCGSCARGHCDTPLSPRDP